MLIVKLIFDTSTGVVSNRLPLLPVIQPSRRVLLPFKTLDFDLNFFTSKQISRSIFPLSTSSRHP